MAFPFYLFCLSFVDPQFHVHIVLIFLSEVLNWDEISNDTKTAFLNQCETVQGLSIWQICD